MNLAYHCTDNYARITGTSIVSVFENNKDMNEINVYIIEHGFTQETKAKFTSLADKYGRKIFFIPIPDIEKEYDIKLVSIKKKWMFDSYSRLFLDRILPENIDRVLYLDGDVLVLGSLEKLWEMDLKGKCCAAGLDCISKPYYELFGLKDTSRYCNSGVILMDLKAWKQKQIDDRVRQYVKKNNGYVFFMEQTVFNVVLQDEIKYLPAKYNVSTLMQLLSWKELNIMRKPLHFYHEDEIMNALEHPLIIHMTGFFYCVNRAWNKVTNHPEQKKFVDYSMLLGWEGEILQPDNRDAKTKFVDAVIHAIPKELLVHLVSFLYNNFRIKIIQKQSEKARARD